MTINEKGYLSKDIYKIKREILKENSEYFKLARQTNKYVHNLKFKIKVNNQNAQEILTSTLCISLLESLSSIYILLSSGLITDSKVILRSMLEKTIKLKYIVLSYENAIEYIQQDEINRLKFMNVILNDKSNSFNKAIKENVSQQERDLLRKKIEEQDIPKPKSLEFLAEKTGMISYYNYVYRILSSNVHSDSRSIEDYLKFDEKYKITQLKWLSVFRDINEDIKTIMYTAITLMLLGIESLNNIFSIEDSKFNNLVEKLKELEEDIKKHEKFHS